MIHYQRTKSSMFLMEIIINILLFSVLCVCSLQFFIKAYQLSENTTTLHHAVTACSNVASLYEAGNGDIDTLLGAYPYAISTNEQIIIYYDENYNDCQKDDRAYYILVERADTSIHKINIRFYNQKEEFCYSIQACNYQPLTPSDIEEAADYE